MPEYEDQHRPSFQFVAAVTNGLDTTAHRTARHDATEHQQVERDTATGQDLAHQDVERDVRAIIATDPETDAPGRIAYWQDEKLYREIRSYIIAGTQLSDRAYALMTNDLRATLNAFTDEHKADVLLHCFTEYLTHALADVAHTPYGSEHAVHAWQMQNGLWGHYLGRFNDRATALEYLEHAARHV